MRVGSSTTSAPVIISGNLDIWGTTTFHGSTSLGGGALFGSATLDFDLTSASTQDLTISVAGAAIGTPVAVGYGTKTTGVVVVGNVYSTGVVTLTATRTCDTTPNPPSQTYKVTVQ